MMFMKSRKGKAFFIFCDFFPNNDNQILGIPIPHYQTVWTDTVRCADLETYRMALLDRCLHSDCGSRGKCSDHPTDVALGKKAQGSYR